LTWKRLNLKKERYNIMDKRIIMNRLIENYNTVQDMGYEVVGIFLQGSQNYELDYEGSDIDCKAVILPKFNDFVLNKKPISTTHVLQNNEHIDLKDIRLMFECFKKQNINFVEILFTKYKIINPKYEGLVQTLFNNNETIANYNNYASVNCISGMSMEKYKALEHPYPATMDKIEKFGYDPKQLHHIVRLNEFIKRYISGELYSKCLISNEKEYLIDVKKGCYTLENARILAKTLDNDTMKIKNDYMKINPPVVDEQVSNILSEVLLSVMKHNFKLELMEDCTNV
jgi:predicted nucleotidyltransferase